ncbi:unnamed protein product, partial [Ixodes hexagonus]
EKEESRTTRALLRIPALSTTSSRMGNASTKNVPDSRTGLSRKDTERIRKSWSLLSKLHPLPGQLIFKAMFVKYPDFVALFPHFRHKKVNALSDDLHFISHANEVGKVLGSIIDCIDEPDKVMALIRKNATDHTTRQGVKPTHFEAMLDVVLEVLRETLTWRLKPAAVSSWEKLIQVSVPPFC